MFLKAGEAGGHFCSLWSSRRLQRKEWTRGDIAEDGSGAEEDEEVWAGAMGVEREGRMNEEESVGLGE